MARYWLYLNDEVAGPFAVEQLIRQRGFSRQTLVCVDDSSGKPTNWISPAEIPELAHIFKAADDQHAAPVPTPAPVKAPSRPAPVRAPRPYTPAVTLKTPSRDFASTLAWLLFTALLLGGAGYFGFQYMHRGDESREQAAAQVLIENARLPASSLYSTLGQYMQEKEIKPRWQFEKVQDGLYNVSLSWYAPTLSLFAFESNTQAQTVRGLNTAAVKLLSEGFPAPVVPHAKTPEAPKKSSAESFPQAAEARRAAVESGDFESVWDSFSARKKAEMARGGISHDGFIRLQTLTHKVDSALKQTLLKTKSDSETEMLALVKETQTGRPDVFVKQFWVFQDGAWKLDDEQKHSAQDSGLRTEPNPSQEPTSPNPSNLSPQSSSPSPAVPSESKPPATTLPGMSN